jgi:hypothetical protein
MQNRTNGEGEYAAKMAALQIKATAKTNATEKKRMRRKKQMRRRNQMRRLRCGPPSEMAGRRYKWSREKTYDHIRTLGTG